jgi:hypothetical protein
MYNGIFSIPPPANEPHLQYFPGGPELTTKLKEMLNNQIEVPMIIGGSRTCGTNDNVGGALNLARWVSPRTIKEVFVTPTDFLYPYMAEK